MHKIDSVGYKMSIGMFKIYNYYSLLATLPDTVSVPAWISRELEKEPCCMEDNCDRPRGIVYCHGCLDIFYLSIRCRTHDNHDMFPKGRRVYIKAHCQKCQETGCNYCS